MDVWTLVYRSCETRWSSRRRVVETYSAALKAYDRLCHILHLEQRAVPLLTLERVSLAYLLSPEGDKIPLLSGAPPHPLIPRTQVLEALAYRPRRPAPQERLPINREVFRRRLQRLHLQFPIPGDANAVLGHIVVALVLGKEQGLAALCQEVLGPLGAFPRRCAANRERLLRRLHNFATHAHADFPAIALALTYLAHAFAEGTESRVWAVCETDRKLRYAEHQQAAAGAASSHV